MLLIAQSISMQLLELQFMRWRCVGIARVYLHIKCQDFTDCRNSNATFGLYLYLTAHCWLHPLFRFVSRTCDCESLLHDSGFLNRLCKPLNYLLGYGKTNGTFL